MDFFVFLKIKKKIRNKDSRQITIKFNGKPFARKTLRGIVGTLEKPLCLCVCIWQLRGTDKVRVLKPPVADTTQTEDEPIVRLLTVRGCMFEMPCLSLLSGQRFSVAVSSTPL